jgi:hypothetical protein
LEGELERAHRWGESLASTLVRRPVGQAFGVVFDSVEGVPSPAL